MNLAWFLKYALKKKILLVILILSLFWSGPSVLAGQIINPHMYAWSNNVGYINFKNVVVSDGFLAGYAWSTNSGWIKFNPAQGGVINDGAGNLTGFAWGEQLGWIDFSQVGIDANGKFFGIATGTLVGKITFDCITYCDVRTDWRPAVATPVSISNVVTASGIDNSGGSFALQPTATTPNQFLTIPTLLDPVLVAEAKTVDIQKDGLIDILDFNLLMVNWGVSITNNSADLNRDGTVDIFDFNKLMVLWGIIYQL